MSFNQQSRLFKKENNEIRGSAQNLEKENKFIKRNGKQQKKDEAYKGYTKYCHTHGTDTHKSSKCKFPKQGHKIDTTFKNMLGGSTKYCQMCNWVDGTEGI